MNAELEEVMEVLRRAWGGQGQVLENGEWRAVTNKDVAERVVQWARTLDRERLHNLGKWGGMIRAMCTVDQPELLIEIDCALEEYAALRADLKAAASDLPIPMPEPGTEMARLLSANVLLRRQNSIERGEAASEVDRLRKAIGAIRDALHQEHLRGTFRDTLWMPENHARNYTVFEFIDTTLER